MANPELTLTRMQCGGGYIVQNNGGRSSVETAKFLKNHAVEQGLEQVRTDPYRTAWAMLERGTHGCRTAVENLEAIRQFIDNAGAYGFNAAFAEPEKMRGTFN